MRTREIPQECNDKYPLTWAARNKIHRYSCGNRHVFSHSFPAVRTILFTHDRQYVGRHARNLRRLHCYPSTLHFSRLRERRASSARALIANNLFTVGIFVNVDRDCSVSILRSCRDIQCVRIYDVTRKWLRRTTAPDTRLDVEYQYPDEQSMTYIDRYTNSYDSLSTVVVINRLSWIRWMNVVVWIEVLSSSYVKSSS